MSDDPTLELPPVLEGLRELAYNYRWSWHAPTAALFEQLDPARWVATHRNPVQLLVETDAIRLQAAARSDRFIQAVRDEVAGLRQHLGDPQTWYRRRYPGVRGMRIAYFSAEFAITESLRIFSGGLGVLAGDHLKSASDLGVPLVAVGLLYREGYFTQRIDATGKQVDLYSKANPKLLSLTLETRFGEPLIVHMPYLDHSVYAQIWR
ncbi:MAG: DUF3417 domain-containing protein, partial [Longimicrobiales bacterium]